MSTSLAVYMKQHAAHTFAYFHSGIEVKASSQHVGQNHVQRLCWLECPAKLVSEKLLHGIVNAPVLRRTPMETRI